MWGGMVWAPHKCKETWQNFIQKEASKDYYKQLMEFVGEESKTHTIFPRHKDLFAAFDYCALEKTKVAIFGQDPYINEGEAHGLAFSVSRGVKIPPSLRNIYKELKDDLNIDSPEHGCLYDWAKQGVLLLNCVLTVRAGESGSHRNRSWETFTDAAIRLLNEQQNPIVFLLWGAYAKNKKQLITNKKHLILEAAHPSPFSANNGFFGCKHFSKTNEFLVRNGIEQVDWRLA